MVFFHTTFNRKVTNQGEILNCDLTEKNTSKLDPYINDHFIVNSVTDFYDRFDAATVGNSDTSSNTENGNNCLFISHENQF